MAFSADELRVLRRALVNVAQPTLVPDHEVRACLRLAQAVDETRCEAVRERAFLVADLARYRAALPGSATGYLEHLQEALTSGYAPIVDDLRALRRLCAERTGPYETARRALRRVRAAHPGIAPRLLRVLPGGLPVDLPPRPAVPPAAPVDEAPCAEVVEVVEVAEADELVDLTDLVEIARRLDADSEGHPSEKGHPGGQGHPDRSNHSSHSNHETAKDGGERMAAKEDDDSERAPRPEPKRPHPGAPEPAKPRPARPVPTPGEVFPPRRPKPATQGRLPATLPG